MVLVLNPFPDVAGYIQRETFTLMSLPAMSFGDRFCFGRKGGIGGSGWCTRRVQTTWAVSGLSFRNSLVGSWWATAVLLLMNGLRKHFHQGSFFPVWTSGCRLKAVTVASTLMGGCSLGHERI